MFVSDRLVFVRLQKTASQHIMKLLPNLFEGKSIYGHMAASNDLIASKNYFVASIRNPWDWYLSLWAYGVQGKGGLANRLTTKNYIKAIRLVKSDPKNNLFKPFHEITKDVAQWRDVYDCNDNVDSFRNWLRLMLDPKNCIYLGNRYEQSGIAQYCGFMTYRYLNLFCKNNERLRSKRYIKGYQDVVKFDKERNYIEDFIRQESLESDLIRVVEKVRIVSEEEKNYIYSTKKTNISCRPLKIAQYYNRDTIELVQQREALLIDRFHYQPPV